MNFDGAEPNGRMCFIEAAIRLLETSGLSEIKARSVSAEAGHSTMGLYKHFSGMPELLQAVVDEGYRRQARVFGEAPNTNDPMANLYALALVCRDFAGATPHLYDLMYGLSIQGRYHNTRGAGTTTLREISPAFDEVFSHLLRQCELLIEKGCVRECEPAHIALQFWSTLHGFIILDLAGHLAEVRDPIPTILMSMCINLVVGMGASSEAATQSAANATSLWNRRMASTNCRENK